MHLVIIRATGEEGMNEKLPIEVYRWKWIAKAMAHSLESTSQSIFVILQCTKQSSGVRGSPGESVYENLELELTKSINPNRREIRALDYRRGIKDHNTTQLATWARKPHNHDSKSFLVTRLNFGQGVGKGDSYRQLALIPTCDTPDLTVH